MRVERKKRKCSKELVVSLGTVGNS